MFYASSPAVDSSLDRSAAALAWFLAQGKLGLAPHRTPQDSTVELAAPESLSAHQVRCDSCARGALAMVERQLRGAVLQDSD